VKGCAVKGYRLKARETKVAKVLATSEQVEVLTQMPGERTVNLPDLKGACEYVE